MRRKNGRALRENTRLYKQSGAFSIYNIPFARRSESVKVFFVLFPRILFAQSPLYGKVHGNRFGIYRQQSCRRKFYVGRHACTYTIEDDKLNVSLACRCFEQAL